MIYFYNKFLLFLLPLSLLPVLFHLLLERKSKVIDFTYVNLIQKVVSHYYPKKKIVDIIVMILRCLIIMFIILFFAGPVGYLNPSKRDTMDLVLALDTSLSMQQKILNTNKLNLCKSYLYDLAKELKNYNIRLKIITFDESVKVLFDNLYGFKDTLLLEKISNISETYKSTNLLSVIKYLTSYHQNFDKIIIFTDLAAHILDFPKNELKEVLEKSKNNLKGDILFCYPEYVDANFYVEDLKSYIVEDEDILELLPKLSVSGAVLDSKINLKFFINDIMVDSRKVDLSSDNKFNYFLENKNILGYFNLPADSILADNNFYFTFLVTKEKKKILCLINEPVYIKGVESKKFYIENLSSDNFYVNVILTSEEYQQVYDVYDGVIVVNVDRVEDIKKYLSNINIFFISESIDIESYESYFSGVEFIEIQESPSGFSLALSDDDEEFKNFFEKFDYKNIRVQKKFLLNITDKKKWNVLLRFNDGSPALLNYENTYLFSFSIDRKNSNFIYKPLFVSFINYVIKRQASKRNIKNFYQVSENIVLDDNITSVIPISQENKRLENFYEKNHNEIKFFVPGIYEVEIAKKDKVHLAVNTNPKESLITIVNKNALKKEISYVKKFNSISFIDILKKNSKELILQWCFGKDFSNEILIILCVLLIIETVLSRFMGRNL